MQQPMHKVVGLPVLCKPSSTLAIEIKSYISIGCDPKTIVDRLSKHIFLMYDGKETLFGVKEIKEAFLQNGIVV